MSWSGAVPLDDLLAAAHRQLRQRAGGDVPAWEEPDIRRSDRRGAQRAGSQAARDEHAEGIEPGGGAEGRVHQAEPAPHGPADPDGEDVEDPYGDDELLAAELAASPAMPPGTPVTDSAGAFPSSALPVEDLAGHARLTPGPALAGWLSGASPAELDDAALVNSVTGWRKVTSWAQAQELAAIAELGRRRGPARLCRPSRPTGHAASAAERA